MRSRCPIANTLDVVGDKWTLLVVRDLVMFGKHRFSEFAGSAEEIPTNILADRLRRLEREGIVTRRPYRTRPVRYEYRLTPKGRDLFPVLREIAAWAGAHLPGVGKPPPGWLEKLEARIKAGGEGDGPPRPGRQ